MSGRKDFFGKKHIRPAVMVLAAAAVFGICRIAAHAAGELSGGKTMLHWKQESGRYPSVEEADKLLEMCPVLCTPVQETYQKAEGAQGFSEEMLADLQEYVRRGALPEAIAAYRDETLLIGEEELRRLCPDYESLLAEYIEERFGKTVNVYEVKDNIVQIYKLRQESEQKVLLLLEYGDSETPWYYIEREGESYRIGFVRLEGYGRLGCQPCEKTVFADGNGYCLLMSASVMSAAAKEEWLLRLCRFTLPAEEEADMPEVPFDDMADYPFDIEETQYIFRRITSVEPVFFYQNEVSPLTCAVQEYVEQNAGVFADRLRQGEIIWGDEEYAELPEGEAKIWWTEPDKYEEVKLWEWEASVSQADYNNDGKEELFWRGFRCGGVRNVRLAEYTGGYRTEAVRLFREDMPVEQMWFAELSGKTVTFEIVEPYGSASPFLTAYLIEGNKKTPLLSCQLVYGRSVEIDRKLYEWEEDPFGITPLLPLTAGIEKETKEQAAFRKEMTAWIREAGKEVSLTLMEGEAPFSEDFLRFIREGAVFGLAGRRFSKYVQPYAVDTEADLTEFIEKYETQESYRGDIYYEMAYHWAASDGTDNYLVNEIWEFEAGINTLYWYRDDGEGLYRKEAITDLSTDSDYCGILSYDGQLYCVIAGRKLWGLFPMRIDVVVLGEAGEWEHYCVSLTYESTEYEMLSFYGEKVPQAVSSYVAEQSEEILTCLRQGEIYRGVGAGGELSKEAWRNIKNRDFSYDSGLLWSTNGHTPYRAVDADNDGEMEYAASYWAYPHRGPGVFFHTVYGWRDGAFAELSLGGDAVLCYEDADDVYGVFGSLTQLWFEELDGVTYLFTVEELSRFDCYLLRVRLIKDGRVQDVGAFLFRHSGAVLEDIQKIEEYESWAAA
ncbi:MAG: hypothetical protein K1W13_06640 [Lachnospiraceae bacterium]